MVVWPFLFRVLFCCEVRTCGVCLCFCCVASVFVSSHFSFSLCLCRAVVRESLPWCCMVKCCCSDVSCGCCLAIGNSLRCVLLCCALCLSLLSDRVFVCCVVLFLLLSCLISLFPFVFAGPLSFGICSGVARCCVVARVSDLVAGCRLGTP